MQEQEKVYISITCDKRQLTIDGDLSLFDRFLATLRSNKQVGAPTPLLRAVCLAYWRERTDNPQGDARGILHQLVIEGLRAGALTSRTESTRRNWRGKWRRGRDERNAKLGGYAHQA